MPEELTVALATVETSEDAQAFLGTAGRILLVLVGAIVLLLIGLWGKRRFLDDDDEGVSMGGISGFGISELRRLRDEGQLTEEEFERARDRIVASARRDTLDEPEPASPPDRPRGKNLDLIREIEES